MGSFRIAVILFLVFPYAASAQEKGEKCADSMINYRWPDIRIIMNKDESYLAKIKPASLGGQGELRSPTAFVYALNKKDYTFAYEAKLPQVIFPVYSLLDSEGRLVVYGDRNDRHYQDDLYIFSKTGALKYHFTGKDVLNNAELEKSINLNQKSNKCAIANPWICWEHEPETKGNHVELLDVLGNLVRIDIETGKIERHKTDKQCKQR